MSNNSKPIEFRSGSIRVAIWTNTNDEGRSSYSVTLTRSYKTAEGFKDTSSLNVADLPVAAKLLEKAFDFTIENPASQVNSDDES